MSIYSKRFCAVAALVMVALASCTLGPGKCHTMSDCDDAATCVEGMCRGGEPAPAQALASQSDASSLPTTDASMVTPVTPVDAAMIDASQETDASDASDASAKDAATDS